jgi:putative tryptophan/tyrosine transport system substrate-binding protein
MKNILCLFLIIACLGVGTIAEAQQPGKVPKIGFLIYDTPALAETTVQAFRQGLRELGYVEGKTIVIEYRFAEGKLDRLSELAAELVRIKVDIIVASNSTAARAAKKVTNTIPIVLAQGSDPIQSGLVVSFARPGGNVTGLTNYSSELLGKRLELLKEVVPKVFRFGFLNDAGSASSSGMLKDAQVAGQTLGIKLQLVEVKDPRTDLEGAFRVIVTERIGAVITSPSPGISLYKKRILELLEQNRIPAIHPFPSWMAAGGLMYYGANTVELFRRAPIYVDKILKGAKPADLPVEQPMKFELVISLKAAKQIGITIPPNLLALADKVIK